MGIFRFKRFSVRNETSAMKVNTDGVLLGAACSLPSSEKAHILDVGTGTGTIALMIAQRLSDIGTDAIITGIDIDQASAQEAAENFAASPWSGCMRAEHCALENLTPTGRYDLIASNPPYYDETLLNPGMRQSTARHTLALSYRELLLFAARYLTEQGTLAMVLPASIEKAVLRDAAEAEMHLHRILRISTTERKPASRMIVEFGLSAKPLASESLIIGSEQYKNLTSDFYLK